VLLGIIERRVLAPHLCYHPLAILRFILFLDFLLSVFGNYSVLQCVLEYVAACVAACVAAYVAACDAACVAAYV